MDAALFFSAPWVPKPMINCREPDRHAQKQIDQKRIGHFGHETLFFGLKSGGTVVFCLPHASALPKRQRREQADLIGRLLR